MSRSRLVLLTATSALAVTGTLLVLAPSNAKTTTLVAALPPVSYAPTNLAMNPVTPGTAISATLAGLDAGEFETAQFGPSPDGAGSPWLNLTMSESKDGDASGVHEAWEADMAEGAIADRLAPASASLNSVVGGSSMTLDAGDGHPADLGGGFGNVASRQLFDAQAKSLSDTEIVKRVEGELTPLGLQVQSVHVLHPLGPAVSIVATVSDPSTMKFTAYDMLQALGGASDYEGYFIEVTDSAGAPLLRVAGAFRSASGRVWVSPSLTPTQAARLGVGRH